MNAPDQDAPAVPVDAPAVESTDTESFVSEGSPWQKDIQAAFEDPAMQTQVSEFMSTKYQPYVTKIEEDRAALAKKAELFDYYQEDPLGMFSDLTRDIFDEESADFINQTVLEALQDDDDEESYAEDMGSADDAPWRNDPEVVAALEYASRKRSEEEEQVRRNNYTELLDNIRAANPGLDIDEEVIAPFIIIAEGDEQRAVAGYNSWIERAEDKFRQRSINVSPDEVPDPPPTLPGSAASVPPTVRKYSSLDHALDDFFDEQKSPPPVLTI